jgi:hypothetical protein
MSEAFEELHIELEDAATRSWLVSMLGTLAMQTQQWHFVGMVDGELRYHSGTFAAPYSWGHLPLGPTMLPREEWTPGMAESLDSLRRELAEAGWIEVGKGEQPWQLHLPAARTVRRLTRHTSPAGPGIRDAPEGPSSRTPGGHAGA